MKEIYLDNAATSWPKPPGVVKAMADFYSHVGASAGRGSYPRAVKAGEILNDTRRLLSQLFNIADPSRIIFTLNASDALNLAIHGISWKPGDTAVITMLEHNSVLRPLSELKKQVGIEVVKVPVSSEGYLDPDDVEKAITPRARILIATHVSNVIGVINPVKDLSRIAHSRGIPVLVDASQSAGALPVDVKAGGIDLLAFPGHKALLGPLGTGALYIGEGIDLKTVREGGTGSLSEEEIQPQFLPDKHEPGSHNIAGIAGWKASLEYINKIGIKKIRKQEEQLTRKFIEGVSSLKKVTVYGPKNFEAVAAVISVNVEGYTPGRLATILYKRYNLMTRYGLHCSPVAHQSIGTFPEGTVRFSFSPFTKTSEVALALKALKEISTEHC